MDSRIADIIVRLKEEKARQGLSTNKIYNMVVDSGEYSSLTTAKRIFAEGSEVNGGFKYDTIRPYVKVLFGTEDPTEEREVGNEEQAEEFREQLDNIKQVIQIKTVMVESLEKENESLKKTIEYLKGRVEDVKSVYHREEARQEEVLKDARETIKRLRRTIVHLSISLGVLIALIIGILIYDKLNPSVGWFREIAANFSQASGLLGDLL